jgi:hypothetical protein
MATVPLEEVGGEIGLPVLDVGALEARQRPRAEDHDQVRDRRGHDRERGEGGDLSRQQLNPLRIGLNDDPNESRALDQRADATGEALRMLDRLA